MPRSKLKVKLNFKEVKQMEKTLSVILIVAALIIGVVCGIISVPSEDCPSCKVCEICQEPQECEVAVVCEETDETAELLDSAIADFLEYLDDEDKLICGNNTYDFDEVTVSKVYKYSIEYDEDTQKVIAKIKLKFDEDDEQSCRETYDFSVKYKEDRDPRVKILTA